jgi:hypothetical protein
MSLIILWIFGSFFGMQALLPHGEKILRPALSDNTFANG